MKKIIFTLLILLHAAFLTFAQNGTQPPFIDNEYIIENAEHLIWMAQQTNSGNDFEDVNFKIKSHWMGLYGYNWTPIGTEKNPFRGNFDGNGYTIYGLNFSTNLQYAGLFGYVENGVIKNLGIKDYRIETSHKNGYIGVLAGYSGSVIINCVTVGGNEWWSYVQSPFTAGGIVGKADGTIYNCQVRNHYKIEGKEYSGGVSGESNGTIIDCFSNAKTLKGKKTGHFVAKKGAANVLASNYRNQDLHAIEDKHNLKDGARIAVSEFKGRLNDNITRYFAFHPLGKWNDEGLIEKEMIGSASALYSMRGSGSELDPFRIGNAQQLSEVAKAINKQVDGFATAYYKLDADIDMNGIDWTPIGSAQATAFKGKFNGNFKEISNLKMKDAATFAGLFGYVKDALVKNVTLNNVNIIGVKKVGYKETYIAGLVGYAENSEITHNVIYGDIHIHRVAGNDHKDMARMIGMFDHNKLISNNLATGNLIGHEEGHDQRDGETIPEFDNKQTVITEGNKTYLITGDLSMLEVRAPNVSLVCCNSNIKEYIALNETTKVRGAVNSGALAFTETTGIHADEINNNGVIVFSRQPSVWTEASGTGWETICLPFDANVYADGEIIKPITKTSKGAFWIREFVPPTTDENNGVIYFASYEQEIPADDFVIKKNTPYIIAFPGERYGVNNLKNKTITYRGVGQIKLNHNEAVLTYENSIYKFEGYYQNTDMDECFQLNEQGSSFELNTQTTVKPYSACFTTKNNYAASVQELRIATGSSQTTDMMDGLEMKKSLNTRVANGIVYLSSENPQKVAIYHATTGIMVREVAVNNDTVMVTDLEKGVYIIGNEKVAVV